MDEKRATARAPKPAFEYNVTADDVTHVYHTKGEAMCCVSDLVALGKVVTVSQLRVYYRREN